MTGREALDAALAAITRKGHEGEAFLEDGISTRAAVSDGKVEALEVREDRGLGVRVFRDGRCGFSFTADLSGPGIGAAVDRAVEIAAVVASDPANRLPGEPGTPADGLPPADPALSELAVRRKIELALAVEEAARAADPRVSGVRESSYQDERAGVMLGNTSGLSVESAATRAILMIELAASEKEESQVGWHAEWRVGADGLDPSLVGREAARKASAKLGASPARTRRSPVVLSPEVTASLFSELSGLFSAEAVLKGRSLLAGRLGETIASPAVVLVDDGRHPDGFSSMPFDGEGVATRESVLIDRGVLKGYLQSSYTAARTGAALTGNALRGGYASRPDISPTNLYLKPTGIDRDSLLRSVSEGVYVMEVMGLHNINHVTGDFSIGASGLAIESGRTAGPVDRMAIAGDILGLLSSVEAVADDLKFLVGGGGATLLLRDIAVSGA